MSALPDTLDLSLLARQYVANGWALVPIASGSKGPRGDEWNKRENCVTTPDGCRRIKANVGLAHAYSGTCVIDLDDFEKAVEWLKVKGVELSEFWDSIDAVKISSGKPNRGKLLYRLPAGVAPLQTKKVGGGALEFRCAAANGTTMQDVLPPSIHPERGEPYAWVYDDLLGAHWSDPPELPAALLKVWRAQIGPEEKPKTDNKAPMGISRDDLAKLIANEDPNEGYDNWLAVGFALHHEMRGADVGLELWDEWSAPGDKYVDWDDMARKWASFGNGYIGREKTIRSIMAAHGVATPDDFDILDDAEEVLAKREMQFAVHSAGEFASGPPPEWIIKGVLPKAQLGMIYGESTAGKSFVAMDMLASIARGVDWRGKRTKQLRTVMIIAEGAGGAKNRVRAYEQHFGVSLSDCPFGVIKERPDLHGKADHKRIIKQIESWGGADVIVVDTLAQSSAGANENSGEDMGEVLAHCHAISEATGGMVILVHHAGKDVTRGARGWSGLKAAMDVEIEVAKGGLTGRTIRLSKSKDGDEGVPMGFKLNIVEIGRDEDDDPITSCVVEHTEGVIVTANPKDGLKAEHQIVLRILAAAADLEVAMEKDDLRRAAAADMAPKGKVDNRMRDAGNAITKLEELGYIERDAKNCYLLSDKSGKS